MEVIKVQSNIEVFSKQVRMDDIFPAENLEEREIAIKQIHKENGQKWRCY